MYLATCCNKCTVKLWDPSTLNPNNFDSGDIHTMDDDDDVGIGPTRKQARIHSSPTKTTTQSHENDDNKENSHLNTNTAQSFTHTCAPTHTSVTSSDNEPTHFRGPKPVAVFEPPGPVIAVCINLHVTRLACMYEDTTQAQQQAQQQVPQANAPVDVNMRLQDPPDPRQPQQLQQRALVQPQHDVGVGQQPPLFPQQRPFIMGLHNNNNRGIHNNNRKLIGIWNLETREHLLTLRDATRLSALTCAMALNVSGRRLLTCDWVGSVCLWDISYTEADDDSHSLLLMVLPNLCARGVCCLSCSGIDECILAGMRDGRILLWNTDTMNVQQPFATVVTEDNVLRGPARSVCRLAIGSCPNSPLIVGANSRTMEVWNIDTKALVQSIELRSHRWAYPLKPCFGEYDRVLAVPLYSGVGLWDVTTGAAIRHISMPSPAQSLTFNQANGNIIVALTNDRSFYVIDYVSCKTNEPASITAITGYHEYAVVQVYCSWPGAILL
jgi:WD40 repeat protein